MADTADLCEALMKAYLSGNKRVIAMAADDVINGSTKEQIYDIIIVILNTLQNGDRDSLMEVIFPLFLSLDGDLERNAVTRLVIYAATNNDYILMEMLMQGPFCATTENIIARFGDIPSAAYYMCLHYDRDTGFINLFGLKFTAHSDHLIDLLYDLFEGPIYFQAISDFIKLTFDMDQGGLIQCRFHSLFDLALNNKDYCTIISLFLMPMFKVPAFDEIRSRYSKLRPEIARSISVNPNTTENVGEVESSDSEEEDSEEESSDSEEE